MEPDRLSPAAGAPARPSAPPPTEWRALSRLRERVEAAVTEIERLRTQNVTLADQLADLQEQLGTEPALALPGDAEPEVFRARVQGFIQAIDDVLAVAPADTAPDTRGDDAPDDDVDQELDDDR